MYGEQGVLSIHNAWFYSTEGAKNYSVDYMMKNHVTISWHNLPTPPSIIPSSSISLLRLVWPAYNHVSNDHRELFLDCTCASVLVREKVQ